MVMSMNHVNVFNQDAARKIISDPALYSSVFEGHFAQSVEELDVTITTTGGAVLNSTFTPTTIVQLLHQGWVQSITRWRVARPMSLGLGSIDLSKP